MTEYDKLNLVTDDVFDEASVQHMETQYDRAREEFESGSWQVKKDLVPDADGNRSLGAADARFKDVRGIHLLESGPHLHDDFIGCVLDAAKWHVSGTGSAGVAVESDGGMMAMQTANADQSEVQVDQNAFRCFRYGKRVRFETRLRLDQWLTQTMLRFGLYRDATHYIQFSLVNGAGAANYRAQTHDGSQQVDADTGVLSDLDHHIFVIRCEDGHIYFDIDGQEVCDFTTSLPTDLMEPFVWLRVTEVSVRTALVDYIDVLQER